MHAGAPPVGVLDLDLARIDHAADHGDVAQAHPAIGAEGEHAAGLRNAAAGIDAGRIVPPLPGIARHFDTGVTARERNARNAASPRGAMQSGRPVGMRGSLDRSFDRGIARLHGMTDRRFAMMRRTGVGLRQEKRGTQCQ